MMELLESLLPEGRQSAQQSRKLNAGSRTATAELDFEKNGRSAHVEVVLNKYPIPVPAMLSQCPDTAYYPYSKCTSTRMPGGSTLVQDRTTKNKQHPADAEMQTVRFTDRHGSQVFVSQTSNGAEKRFAQAKSQMPLTRRQLSDIATSSAWQRVFATMPAAPSAPPVNMIARMTGRRIANHIEELLPANFHVTQAGGSLGFGHLVVDDGQGKSLVSVNVQRWKTGDAEIVSSFKTADTLPDGTRIKYKKGPLEKGSKGTVAWSVDTFHRDGLRIFVSAINASAYPLPPTRPRPALDMQQLRSIAISAVWQGVDSK
ncbi:hypothetical protein [Streptomyces sp. NPDC127036]|uniref:hypothetical protein n=1 Tax=Streptomyces sp. NPDC127036 TaxID=3347112 RepID=UPI003658DCE5